MTNTQIILKKSCELMNAGILKGTGKMIKASFPDGLKEIEEPEAIHTFAGWKALGYSVKKGEHSSIKFNIWKYVADKKADENEQAEGEDKDKPGRMIQTLAAFFTAAQVEPIQ